MYLRDCFVDEIRSAFCGVGLNVSEDGNLSVVGIAGTSDDWSLGSHCL